MIGRRKSNWLSLVVKTPNQQVDDHTVKCKLDWSVARLKREIRYTYPTKPKIKEQRLLYRGQLLQDSVLLRDVLRTYIVRGDINRTIHLMCATSSNFIPSDEVQKHKQNTDKVHEEHGKIDVNNGATTFGFHMPSESLEKVCPSSSYQRVYCKYGGRMKCILFKIQPELQSSEEPTHSSTQNVYSGSTYGFLPVMETQQHNNGYGNSLQEPNERVEDINTSIWQRMQEFIISLCDEISIFIFSILPDEPILM